MMDTIGWYIATTHQVLGHGKAAATLGVPAGDKDACLLCAYEADPTEENKRAVIEAIGSTPVGACGPGSNGDGRSVDGLPLP
jgi:hypothetical protein